MPRSQEELLDASQRTVRTRQNLKACLQLLVTTLKAFKRRDCCSLSTFKLSPKLPFWSVLPQNFFNFSRGSQGKNTVVVCNSLLQQRSHIVEPHEQYEKANNNSRTVNYELPRSLGAQTATRDQWRNYSKRMKGRSQSEYNTQLWM